MKNISVSFLFAQLFQSLKILSQIAFFTKHELLCIEEEGHRVQNTENSKREWEEKIKLWMF